MTTRQIGRSIAWKTFAAAALAVVFVIAGCNSNPKYADSQDAVNNSLTQNNLGAIHVAQDRDKGVITLTGTVPTESQKEEAQSIAKTAAPTYTVADEIAVVPPAQSDETKAASSDIDDAIESNYKAKLKMNRTLERQDISIKSTNGAVVLTGSVASESEKREAEEMAKNIPNVHQVVNEIEVKSSHHHG